MLRKLQDKNIGFSSWMSALAWLNDYKPIHGPFRPMFRGRNKSSGKPRKGIYRRRSH